MEKLIVATQNAGKVREIKEMLRDLGLEVITMREAGIDIDIEENGTTFEENALIKARAIAELTDSYVMADDSGLEIDALNKEPGVYSARYLGKDTPYSEKNQIILDRLSEVARKERTARFVCAMALVKDGQDDFVCRGTIEGYIGYEPVGENGFGYDPIFYVEELGTSTANISLEEKNKISHRAKALRMVEKELKSRIK